MRVLVADDELAARMIAQKVIESFGYQTVVVDNGAEALEILEQDDPPRLAVLDWMMPGMDGLEICKRMVEKQDRPLIYTILLTSRSEQQDLLEALENGAYDFQAKPLDSLELRCRLQVGQRLIESEARVTRYAANMEQLAEERARQLVHADRLAALGTMMAGIVHEINNPLGYINGNAQTQQMMWKELESWLYQCREQGMELPDKVNFCLKEMPENIESILQGAGRLDNIIRSMKRFSRNSNDALEAVDLQESLENALLLCSNELKYHVKVVRSFAETLPMIKAVSQRLEQVFVNLLVNAADAMKGQKNGTLTITTRVDSDKVWIIFKDTGPGIPEETAARIFSPFYTTKPVGKGTGLGLSISRGIVREYGGDITLASKPGCGAVFHIWFPVAE